MDQDSTEISPELESLYNQAKERVISVPEFLEKLGALGITDFSQAIHASNAFAIDLSEAKKAYVEQQPGGIEAWEAQFESAEFEILAKGVQSLNSDEEDSA